MLLESIYNKILLEGSRDNALIPVMQQYGINMSLSQFKQVMLRKLSGAGIRSLSLGGNFYLLGAIMYYLNGDLTVNTPEIFNPNRDEDPDKWQDTFKRDICIKLNALIMILRNHYIDSMGASWEQPEDFGKLPLNKLLKKYGSKINKALGVTKKNKEGFLTTNTTAGENYTYEVITNYDQCTVYHPYTDWCITWGEQHYNGYTKEAMNSAGKPAHFIIFKVNGFENVPDEPEMDKWLEGPRGYPKPQDTYGNSLIALLQDNESSTPIYITSRWNHGNSKVGKCEADYAYTTDEFLRIIGCDESILAKVYNEWAIRVGAETNTSTRKEKMNAIRGFKYAQMSINNGNTVENIFKDKIYPLATGKKGRVATALVYTPIASGGKSGYVTLYDRGKLFYDDYLVKEDKMYGAKYFSNFVKNSKEFSYEKPLMLRDNNYAISMYSPMLRKFLNIGGITSFPKYDYSFASGYYYDHRRYATIGMSSNQLAIVDMRKCEPAVVADNGNPWFETIQQLGVESKKKNRKQQYTYLTDIYDDVNYQYILTYDSAADEKYLFDPATETYMSIDKMRNIDTEDGILGGFEPKLDYYYSSMRVPGHALLTKTTEVRYEYWDGSYTYEQYAYINMGTKEFLEVNGYKVFSNVGCVGNVVGIVPDDHTYGDEMKKISFFHDIGINKDIALNGEPIKMNGYAIHVDLVGKNRDNPVSYVSIGDDKYKYYLIYNPLKHELMEYNGNYLFEIVNKYEGIIKTGDGEEIQITTPENDIQKHEYAMQQAAENIKRHFNTILEQMNRYNKNLC